MDHLNEFGKLLAKKLVGLVIQEVIVVGTDISIVPKEGKIINLNRLMKVDFTDWVVNTSEDKVELIDKDGEKYMGYSFEGFKGTTITRVGFYCSMVGDKRRASYSITTQYDPKEDKGKLRSLAVGFTVI